MDKDRTSNAAITQQLPAAALRNVPEAAAQAEAGQAMANTEVGEAMAQAEPGEAVGLPSSTEMLERVSDESSQALAGYKQILRQALERRPAGIRRRLADVLGKNRSFISQLSNPSYSTPIPAPYVEPIFAVCHFSASERENFLMAYERAHPGRLSRPASAVPLRRVELHLPDLGSEERNADFERLLQDLAFRLANLARTEKTTANGAFP